MKHIHQRSNTYHYRRRVPTELEPYIHTRFITRSLSKNITLSRKLATMINGIVDELLVSVMLGHTPDIAKLGINTEQTSPIDEFLNMDRAESSQVPMKMHMDLLTLLFPRNISGLNYQDIDRIKTVIQNLPKRNIQKYKEIPLKEIVSLNVPDEDKLAVRGINAYLKTFRSFLIFCHQRGYISAPLDVPLVKKKVSAREEQVSLDKRSLASLEELIEDKLTSAYRLLYLSGMRPSEAYKCSITTVNGIKCFDLTDKSISLKNSSSYRMIPVHESLDDPKKMLSSLRTMSVGYLGKRFRSIFDKGTLYSLRHTFGDLLAKEDVPLYIISELMGHSHKSQTGDRYIKGFSTEVLKKAIDKLPSV